MNELQKSFGAHPVPAAIADLWAFQREVKVSYSGNFELTQDGRRSLLAWFDGDQGSADRFVVFGTDGMGSLYGFWLYPGRTLGDAPVVYLNVERCDNTVLASTLKDFLALLTLDREDPGMLGLWGERLVPSPGHERFVTWATEKHGVVAPAPEAAEQLVRDARAAHPDFDAWVEDHLAEG